MHVAEAARVTYIQSECLRVLGASPGAVLHLNNIEKSQEESDPTAPCSWRNLTTGLKETFLCKGTTRVTGHSPRAVLKQIIGNTFKLVQLEGLNCL